MEKFTFRHAAAARLAGARKRAIVGVVASGNLEALFERLPEGNDCVIEVATPIQGYRDLWAEVVSDFVERRSPGGLRVSINDGGARPDTVALRLAQGARLMERD